MSPGSTPAPEGRARGPRNAVVAVALLVLVLVVVLAGLLRGSDGAAGAGAGVGSPSAASPAASAPGRAPSSGPSGRASAGTRDADSGLRVVALATLPREAQQTVRLIDAGGPFPYAKDGVTFGNRERVLPRHPSGWYREYTVPTPGEGDRGARRIVTGDDDRLLYYTADHYRSFVSVAR